MAMGENHRSQYYGPIFRSEVGYVDQNYYMEKRQLFLRSYQFCRKKSVADKIKRTFTRVKRVICVRLRSARKLRKLSCFSLRYAFHYRRRRFLRLLNNTYRRSTALIDSPSSITCFWRRDREEEEEEDTGNWQEYV